MPVENNTSYMTDRFSDLIAGGRTPMQAMKALASEVGLEFSMTAEGCQVYVGGSDEIVTLEPGGTITEGDWLLQDGESWVSDLVAKSSTVTSQAPERAQTIIGITYDCLTGRHRISSVDDGSAVHTMSEGIPQAVWERANRRLKNGLLRAMASGTRLTEIGDRYTDDRLGAVLVTEQVQNARLSE